MANLGCQSPPIVTLPLVGSISIVPPPKLMGKSLERSNTKKDLEPFGNVKRSSPARRVEVASILMSLSSVCVKYPGEAS